MAHANFSGNGITLGDKLMLFDAQGKSIAFATSHTLTKTLATTEINCKDAGIYGSQAAGKLSWEITSENLYSNGGYKAMRDAMNGRTPIMVYFGEASQSYDGGIDSPDENWTKGSGNITYGNALVTSLTLNAASGDNATMSITLTGCGALTSGSYL